MVNEARHRDLALDGLDTQHGARDTRLRLVPDLGLSCGKGQMSETSVFLLYQLGLDDNEGIRNICRDQISSVSSNVVTTTCDEETKKYQESQGRHQASRRSVEGGSFPQPCTSGQTFLCVFFLLFWGDLELSDEKTRVMILFVFTVTVTIKMSTPFSPNTVSSTVFSVTWWS